MLKIVDWAAAQPPDKTDIQTSNHTSVLQGFVTVVRLSQM
jgi:hypothetical protein